jgi:uncharacterized membrane protein
VQASHPLHTVLLAGTVPVFLGALFSDIAYWTSFEIQWKNFASWSLVWGLVLGGLALVWALVGMLRVARRGPRSLLSIVLLVTAWLLGFVNVLVHAQDAWASMPAGLILSVVVVLLVMGAAWFGLSDPARAHAR